ncbi:hypothetical protein ACU4GD_18665 [Cupriavidus basilensis]
MPTVARVRSRPGELAQASRSPPGRASRRSRASGDGVSAGRRRSPASSRAVIPEVVGVQVARVVLPEQADGSGVVIEFQVAT